MKHPPTSNVLTFDNAEQLSRAGADRFVEIHKAAVQKSGRFSVALSGGSTPKGVYELLGSEEYRHRLDWSKTHLFFGDERCVPPDHPDSNYRLVNDILISKVPVPPQNVHRMAGEGEPLESARAYEKELRLFFERLSWPRFDWVILGMGEDGHTASLFPNTAALKEVQAWVVANWVGQLGTFRLTLTASTINHAAHVSFLVTGIKKAERVAEVLLTAPDPERLPAQLIKPTAGSLDWLLDKQAAARLE